MGREFLGLITPAGGISIPLLTLRGIVPVMKCLLRASYGKWRKTGQDGPDLGRMIAQPPSGKRGSWQAPGHLQDPSPALDNPVPGTTSWCQTSSTQGRDGKCPVHGQRGMRGDYATCAKAASACVSQKVMSME